MQKKIIFYTTFVQWQKHYHELVAFYAYKINFEA